MSTKTVNLYVHIDPNIKMQAEEILKTLGISVPCAINMFYSQIVLKRGLPFEVRIPKDMRVDMNCTVYF
jgi:DNA-damage-inducible protein J